MARIRTVKPEFWTSEQIVECSPIARLLFIGLWNFCDDQGVHPYSPKTIKMQVFPGDDFSLKKVEDWLLELISNGLIKTYHIEDKKFLLITGWHHQKIDRPSNKYPPPVKFDDHSTSIRLPIDDGHPPEGKVREGKGKDNKRAASFVLPEYIPQETWGAYLAIRIKKRAAQTDYALNLIIDELEKIKKQHGHDPLEVLKKSIKNGWTDVYPLKENGNDRSGRNTSSGPGIQTTPPEWVPDAPISEEQRVKNLQRIKELTGR